MNIMYNSDYLHCEGSDEDSEPKEKCHGPSPPIACEARPGCSVIPSSLLEYQNTIEEGAFSKVHLALLRSHSPDVPARLEAVRLNLISTYCITNKKHVSWLSISICWRWKCCNLPARTLTRISIERPTYSLHWVTKTLSSFMALALTNGPGKWYSSTWKTEIWIIFLGSSIFNFHHRLVTVNDRHSVIP